MKPVLYSFAYALDYFRDLVADVPEREMSAQRGGIVNHSSWLVGHLIFSCQELAAVVGVPPWLPRDWAKRYGPGSAPESDASAYVSKQVALDMLREAQTRLVQAIETLGDEDLDRQFPQESLRDIFPTVRHALTQVMIGHTAYHIGQMSVWRKSMGLPPIGRSFE